MDTEGDAMKRDAIGTFTDVIEQAGGQILGTTSRFPDGALTPDDEGDLRFAITAHSGKVVLAFWVGLTPKIARGLADALNKYAGEA